MHRLVSLCYMLANLCIYVFNDLNVNLERRRLIAMELIKILLIILAFFLGLSFLVHICSKKRYGLKYCSKKRKIEIYPTDKPQPTNR